jgi:hypothetical protein
LSLASLIADPSWRVDLVPAADVGNGIALPIRRESDALSLVQRLARDAAGAAELRRLASADHRPLFLLSHADIVRLVATQILRGRIAVRARLRCPAPVTPSPSAPRTASGRKPAEQAEAGWAVLSLISWESTGLTKHDRLRVRVLSAEAQSEEREGRRLVIADAAHAEAIAHQLVWHPVSAAQLSKLAPVGTAAATGREALAAWTAQALATGKIKALIRRPALHSSAPAPASPVVLRKPPPAIPPPRKETHWIEILLLDEQGRPVPNESYEITLANGFVVTGTLDADGRAREDGIVAGTCKVTLPSIHGAEWRPA